MPIYEFECRECGHRFDHLQKVSDADPSVCPSCHAERLHRLLSAPAFRLAGSGWYETDFKKPGDQRHNLAGDAGAPTTASETRDGADKAADGKSADAPATPAATPPPPATAAGSGAKAAAPAAD
ncbi:MAG: zinc ribbon domain-containing protein [Rhodanobacter sp.]